MLGGANAESGTSAVLDCSELGNEQKLRREQSSGEGCVFLLG